MNEQTNEQTQAEQPTGQTQQEAAANDSPPMPIAEDPGQVPGEPAPEGDDSAPLPDLAKEEAAAPAEPEQERILGYVAVNPKNAIGLISRHCVEGFDAEQPLRDIREHLERLGGGWVVLGVLGLGTEVNFYPVDLAALPRKS